MVEVVKQTILLTLEWIKTTTTSHKCPKIFFEFSLFSFFG